MSIPDSGRTSSISRNSLVSEPTDQNRQPQESKSPLRQQKGIFHSMTKNSGLNASTPSDRANTARTDVSKMKPLTEPAPKNYVSESPLVIGGNKEKLESMLRDAQLANYPYTQDEGSLPDNYKTDKDLALKGAEWLGLTTSDSELNKGMVIDPKSGLTAALLVNSKDKEIVIVFGGTTSGKKAGADLLSRSRPGKNFMTTLSQWGANFKAALGGVPKSYQQAADLAERMQSEVDRWSPTKTGSAPSPFHDYTVRLVGHSKGGGEAIYASLRQPKAMKAVTFCPSHLSDGIVKTLPEKNVNQAKQNIISYSPYGDPVSALRGVFGISGLGTGIHFDGEKNSNPVDRHDQFLRHVKHFCDSVLNPHGRSALTAKTI